MKTLLASIAASLCLCGTAQAGTVLVSPTGQPVGGIYQQWVNQDRVPSANVTVVFTVGTGNCSYVGYTAPACSDGVYPGSDWTGENIWLDPNNPLKVQRQSLYFELGHIYDWTQLSNGDRGYLARNWWLAHHHWWDTVAGLVHGDEDGLEGMFGAIYQDCAYGRNDKGDTVALADQGWSASPRINTCNYLRRLGA